MSSSLGGDGSEEVEVELDEDGFAAERAVGISEFINPNFRGFTGILKHWFADFRVFEIGLDGQVIKVTDKLCDDRLIRTKDEERGIDGKEISLDDVRSSFGSIIADDAVLQNILYLAKNEATMVDQIITPVITDKESRTKIHQEIRTLFKGVLQTEAEINRIKIYRRAKAGNKIGRDDRNMKPIDQQRYLEFVLHKENMDTIDAIQLISKKLHMPAKDFTYAGTKDKRAITVQKIVVRNATPNKILGINKIFDSNRIRISDVKAAKQPLSLGDLQGNRFELVIRNIMGANYHEISQLIGVFKSKGFVNYFGLQRFGTTSVPSHKIGIALLKGDYKEAVDLILDPRDGEGDQRAIAARKYWREIGDAKIAQQMFPLRYTAERQILSHYAKDIINKNDHLGAILSINRELRLMYVHSVQSLLWNRISSLRMLKYGSQVIEGDLVLSRGSKSPAIVTGDNIKEYTIRDVVLPIPGHASIFPTNEIANQFTIELNSLSIDSLEASFKPKNKALWDLPGAYRNVFVIPENVSFEIGYYSNPDADLPREFAVSTLPYLGLAISFDLPSSCYATMALRELMHCGTDPRQHKIKTKRHKLMGDNK